MFTSQTTSPRPVLEVMGDWSRVLADFDDSISAPATQPVPRRSIPSPAPVGPIPSTDGVDVERLCRKMRKREDDLTVPAGADLRAARVAYRWLVWSFGRTGQVPDWASAGPLRSRLDSGRFDRVRQQMVEHVVADCRAVRTAKIAPMEYERSIEHPDDDEAERARRAVIYAARWEEIEWRYAGAVDGHDGELVRPRRMPPRPRPAGKPVTLIRRDGTRQTYISLTLLAEHNGYGLSTVSEARRDRRKMVDGGRVVPAKSIKGAIADAPTCAEA